MTWCLVTWTFQLLPLPYEKGMELVYYFFDESGWMGFSSLNCWYNKVKFNQKKVLFGFALYVKIQLLEEKKKSGCNVYCLCEVKLILI
jgi:hypothetical protein